MSDPAPRPTAAATLAAEASPANRDAPIFMAHGTHDPLIPLSRATRARALLPTDAVSPLFQAALEATEEAVYNSLFQATSVTGNGRTAEAIPIDRVRELLKKYGRE